jgi:hypothetical protein
VVRPICHLRRGKLNLATEDMKLFLSGYPAGNQGGIRKMDSSDVICDHSSTCHNIEGALAKVEYCTGKTPHRFNHEADGGFRCPHANGAWVKAIHLFVRNPKAKEV